MERENEINFFEIEQNQNFEKQQSKNVKKKLEKMRLSYQTCIFKIL